jgi:transposase
VTLPPDLSKLSHPEKDGLILTLAAQLAAAQERIATQDARIAALEARLDALTRPAKTPDNSSKPPWQGQKQDRPPTERPPRKSCPGVGRTLHPNPDRVVDARLAACLKCQAAFPEAVQTPQLVYERFELPAIKPDVTQVRLFGGRCVCCGERVSAEAPAGLEPGSPFGQSIAALVGLSARRLRDRHGTAVDVDGRDLLAVDQRGCDQQHVGPRASASACGGGNDPRDGARQSGGVFA